MIQTPAHAFFAEVSLHAEAATQQALQQGDLTDRWYRIGGLVLHIRFLGSALLDQVGAGIEHREIADPGAGTALTLHCWDCTSLGRPYPEAPVARAAFTPRGEVQALSDARFQVGFEPQGRLLSMVDLEAREAFFCVGDATRIPRFDAAEPIRDILAWWMRASGRQLMHAGAVGCAQGGVLLIGRSGAGKSNTALTCLHDGLGYAADDFCVVAATPEPVAYSLYCTAKTRESDCERSPFLLDMAPDYDPAKLDKIIFYLNRARPERLLEAIPIKAILLVKRGGDVCRLEPVSPSAALAASAPDTAMLLAGSGPEVLRSLGRLVRAAPCFTLHLGPDPSRITLTIRTLLGELGVVGAET